MMLRIICVLSWTLLFFLKFYIAQKMKFSIKDFFSKCDQIRRKLWIWSHFMRKPLMENFIFCPVLLSIYSGQKAKVSRTAVSDSVGLYCTSPVSQTESISVVKIDNLIVFYLRTFFDTNARQQQRHQRRIQNLVEHLQLFQRKQLMSKTVNYFRKKAPLQMFDWVLDTSLGIKGRNILPASLLCCSKLNKK